MEHMMIRAAVVRSVAASIKALVANLRLGWQRLAAVHSRRQRGEYERLLDGSTDRFELERRERAWNRSHASDGSLLGW
jgi:hypothetical protein